MVLKSQFAARIANNGKANKESAMWETLNEVEKGLAYDIDVNAPGNWSRFSGLNGAMLGGDAQTSSGGVPQLYTRSTNEQITAETIVGLSSQNGLSPEALVILSDGTVGQIDRSGNGVQNFGRLQALIEDSNGDGLPVGQLQGVAASGMEILPQMASAELGYWNPTIITDEKGKATLTFRLPERSTAWKLKSRGIDGDALFGQAEADIIAKKDLFGELRTPLAFVEGDKATVQVDVHNSTVKIG